MSTRRYGVFGVDPRSSPQRWSVRETVDTQHNPDTTQRIGLGAHPTDCTGHPCRSYGHVLVRQSPLLFFIDVFWMRLDQDMRSHGHGFRPDSAENFQDFAQKRLIAPYKNTPMPAGPMTSLVDVMNQIAATNEAHLKNTMGIDLSEANLKKVGGWFELMNNIQVRGIRTPWVLSS